MENAKSTEFTAVFSTFIILLLDCSMGYNTVDTIDYSLRDMYCDQPLFEPFRTKTSEVMLVDNICITFFPLPDDPDTFVYYQSIVYCDGSNSILTHITTQTGIGQSMRNSVDHTLQDNVIGYAGCDTYISYQELVFGDNAETAAVIGLSPNCSPIGLSCLRKVEEVISSRCLPESEYYILPMKLPNRCVTQQLCLQPPNPFYNKLPGVAVI